MIVTILAFIGSITLLCIAYFLAKLVVAFLNCSDCVSARTPKLPAEAYHHKVVWITGASSGIGRELALLLASQEVHLILSSRSEEDLEGVARECRGAAASVSILVLDLSISDGTLTKKAQDALILHGGSIDILVNNGGVGQRSLARDATHEVDQYLCQVDYLAHAELTKALLPTMESKGGTIVNTNSVAGKIGKPVGTAYSGAKFALRGFMDALRSECLLMDSHVYILNVQLGSTRTNGPNKWISNITQGVIQKFTGYDSNILNGLDPTFVAERILAVAYQQKLPECWLAPRRELLALYISQYMPITGWRLMMKKLEKQYIITNKKDD